MAATRAAVSVEFIVKPREDLYLEGKLRRLPRVLKGENCEFFELLLLYNKYKITAILGEPYPCQMQKSQAFSCLFRHYAKHNGLKKEG